MHYYALLLYKLCGFYLEFLLEMYKYLLIILKTMEMEINILGIVAAVTLAALIAALAL